MSFAGTWGDVTRRSGSVVWVDADYLYVGNEKMCQTPEPLLFVRADDTPAGEIVAIGQGQRSGRAWMTVLSKDHAPGLMFNDLGPTHGVFCVETDGARVVWQVSPTSWAELNLRTWGKQLHVIPTAVTGTSQGFLDITVEPLFWTDLGRMTHAGHVLPQKAGPYVVGQHRERNAIVASDPGGALRVVVEQDVPLFEPRAAYLNNELIVLVRAARGLVLVTGKWDSFPLLVTHPAPPSKPEAPPEVPSVSLPNYYEDVAALAAAFPEEFNDAHRPDRGERAWTFIKRVAAVLHGKDPRVGLNGKRGGPELSMDAIAIKLPAGESMGKIVDVIAGAGGPNPKPAWQIVDELSNGRWVKPEPLTSTPVPPVTPPVPQPPANVCRLDPREVADLVATVVRAELETVKADLREAKTSLAGIEDAVAAAAEDRHKLADVTGNRIATYADMVLKALGDVRCRFPKLR